MRTNHKIALGFLTKSEVARLYGITTKTLANRLQDYILGKKLQMVGYYATQRYLTLRQVLIIFDHFGYPDKYRFIQEGKINYLPLREYTKQELADFYGISSRTFYNFTLLLPMRTATGEMVSISDEKTLDLRQVAHIFTYFGHPFYYTEKPDDILPQTENDIRRQLLIAQTYGQTLDQYLQRREAELTARVVNETLKALSRQN